MGFEAEIFILFMVILVPLDVLIGCFDVGFLDGAVDLFGKVKFWFECCIWIRAFVGSMCISSVNELLVIGNKQHPVWLGFRVLLE